MKIYKHFLFLIVFILLPFLSQAAYSELAAPKSGLNPSDIRAFKISDDFLKHMGFEDYVKESQTTLATDKALWPVAKWALQQNVDNFEALNAARKIGDFTYAVLNRTKDRASLLSKISVLTQVISQQLKNFPQLRFEPLDLGEIKGKTVDELLEIKNKKLKVRADERFDKEKSNLVKAFLGLWAGLSDPEKQDIAEWLDDTLSDALWDAYTAETRQQNRYLGRAIILGLEKYLRENKLGDLENVLALDLRKESLFIENYVLGQFMTQDRDLKYVTYSFKSGDIAFEYSHGLEAFFTSLVVRPHVPENVKIAESYKLNNSYSDATKFLSTDEYYKVVDKKAVGLPLGFQEQRIYNTFWDSDYSNGFSHCGLVELRTDPETGISMAWIWDTFPDTNGAGGVRLLTPEGFSVPEKHLKIGFLRYDPKKILTQFKKQIASRGYLKDIWKGYSTRIAKYESGEWGPIYDETQDYTWPTKVDEATISSWLQTDEINADSWYQKTILPRVFDRVHSYVSSSDAVVFAAGLVNARSMLYCSQLIVLAHLEAANFDLQSEWDTIPSLVKLFGGSLKKIVNLAADQRIVSPNGLIWQSPIFGSLVTIYNNRSRVPLHAGQDGVTLAEHYTHRLDSLSEVKNDTIVDNLNGIILPAKQRLPIDSED